MAETLQKSVKTKQLSISLEPIKWPEQHFGKHNVSDTNVRPDRNGPSKPRQKFLFGPPIHGVQILHTLLLLTRETSRESFIGEPWPLIGLFSKSEAPFFVSEGINEDSFVLYRDEGQRKEQKIQRQGESRQR